MYGTETMRCLLDSNVLISGLNGLGAEIAKNLALTGFKSVTIHDVKNVEMWDLSGNFFLSEDDIGKNRAVACVAKLQELNNNVVISALTEELTTQHLSKFQAVVFTDIGLDKAYEFDDYCHTHKPPISFIKSEVCGLFGSVFCDFGPKFTVLDVDGEDPHTGIISSDNPALVSCVGDLERIEFRDKVKEPKVLCFKALREAMRDTGDFLASDFSKCERPLVLHLAFEALDKFKKEYGRYPAAGCEKDAQSFLNICASINESSVGRKLDTIDEKLFQQFASGSRAVLNPMAAMFGGIVGQEAVKACSGKFHPLYQFFYFDSVESLPTYTLDPENLKPSNNRYDAQVSIFGSKLQKRLEKANAFVVGSGALGCEFLKNLALMGVSCSNQAKLTITDDDAIEKGNLSSHFLFRDWNIGQAKSTVAATAAGAINPSLHIEALQAPACPDTENVFNDTFWEGLDVVISALDNVNGRMYMGMRCLYMHKPLLHSQTFDAKCNTQMVIPHLTENYGDSRDAPEKKAPLSCMLNYFPENINHCLAWARSEFEDLFVKSPNEVNSFLANPLQYAEAMRRAGDAQAREVLERVSKNLDDELCISFHECLRWARMKFDEYFSKHVKQLRFTFPEDAATSIGAPFWSAPKRFPHVLEFSVDDPYHLNFIMYASILRAESSGVSVPEWPKNSCKLAAAVKKIRVPNFTPKRGFNIVTDEEELNHKNTSAGDVAVINYLLAKLHEDVICLPPGFQMKPIQFEKDDDTNFHMDLVAGLANLRARNYNIPEVDKLKAKFIDGGIVPGIVTSSAMATGLVCLELYKVIAGGHPIEDYRNTFANLALPLVSMAEPVPAKVTKHKDMSWTVWDRWCIKGNLTVGELVQWFAEKGLTVSSISCGASLLYNKMFAMHKDRLPKNVVDIAKEVAKVGIPDHTRHLDIGVACKDDDENDVDIPTVSIYFR
ncbi:ubiquitin-activating enzyme E1 3-like [Lolium rigidum]|uniref:ubiquitin-activating enzyme E1 3-like n=1 Tax=Lolium rigidum TaxID=89674 RepID=UPI001F5D0286|nr:ubiquitin-activating enzyme E1 3-like [Lolium rigidum]